ncbi:hypothetical protein D3C76_773530 [compost metagenome]
MAILSSFKRRGTRLKLNLNEQWMASQKLLGVLDTVNARWARGTVSLASAPVDPSWVCIVK